MDLFSSMDKKLADFSDQDFGQFLDEDLFTPSPSNDSNSMDFSLDSGMDHDWLDTFFDDPVLNDRMISDALQPHPQVQSEHSYSLANEKAVDMTIKKEQDKDSDSDVLCTTVNPNNMTLSIKTEEGGSSEVSVSQQSSTKCSYILTSPHSTTSSSQASPRQLLTTSLPSTTTFIKKEPQDGGQEPPTMVTVTRTVNPQTLLKPTIILATQPAPHTTTPSYSERLVLPKVSVKVESSHATASSLPSPDHCSYDQLSLPPTPPSSNSSDSEGCQSPERSLPPSPVRSHHSLMSSHKSHHHHHSSSSLSPRPSSPGLSTPFIMNPIPSSGVLLLSEEEKRTLISEGYPIPAKLPLTKGEEKNLKKIRRKIKNKISAQESRRKKKEYLESLERKVESYSQENVDLKKKVDTLENNNRSLLSQLQKLQSIVGKLRPQSTSQTSTCLMVLVLCFAVFLGTWSPMSWSIGYSSSNATPGSLPSLSDHHHFGGASSLESLVSHLEGGEGLQDPGLKSSGVGVEGNSYNANKAGGSAGVMGPPVKEASSDPYSTGNLKSRVLLSVREEEDEGPSHQSAPRSFCLRDYIEQWFHSAPHSAPQVTESPAIESMEQPPVPKVEVLDVELEHNQTGEGGSRRPAEVRRMEEQASMHPDISVMAQTRQTIDTKA